MKACSTCTHNMCCSRAEEGGAISPAFLAEGDIHAIECVTGLGREEFSFERIDAVSGRKFRLLRFSDAGGCVFFNSPRGCKIYQNRPFDCRLFPLDVHYRSGEYSLILYNLPSCFLTREELEGQVKFFEERFLPVVGEWLFEYAGIEMGILREVEWTVLKKLGEDPTVSLK